MLFIFTAQSAGGKRTLASIQQRNQEHVDIGCQTTDDLVEMWLPCLRRRIVRHSGSDGTACGAGGTGAAASGEVTCGEALSATTPDRESEEITALRQCNWSSTDPKTRQKEVRTNDEIDDENITYHHDTNNKNHKYQHTRLPVI